MRRLMVFAPLFLLSFFATASDRAFVATSFSGMTLRQHTYTFLPGEVVTVRERGKKQSRVESVDRTWETRDGVWVPNEILLYPRSFEKIKNWTGQRKIETGGGDYDAIYRISSNGAFTVTVAGDRRGKRSGHLYQSKMIVWPRIDSETGSQPEQVDIFVLMPNGELCFPVPSDSCVPAP